MMAPMVLKKLAPDFEISSQKRLAEKRLDSATVQPAMRAWVVVTNRALPWNRGSAV